MFWFGFRGFLPSENWFCDEFGNSPVQRSRSSGGGRECFAMPSRIAVRGAAASPGAGNGRGAIPTSYSSPARACQRRGGWTAPPGWHA